MKQELTLAVVLLAIGGAICFTNLAQPNQGDFQANSTNSTVTADVVNDTNELEGAQESFRDDSTVSASFQSDVEPQSQPIAPITSATQETNEQTLVDSAFAHAGFDIQKPDPNTIRLLAAAAGQLSNSKPFKTAIKLNARMFGQNVSASGNYYQMGQGSHKTRIELTFDSIKSKPSLFQICDGRFFYTIRSELGSANPESTEKQQKQSLEFVDLHRVQEAAGERPSQLTPTGWVATGGLSSLLQHLASGFNFGPPNQLENSMVMIRGVWEPKALQQVVSSSEEAPELGNPIQWEKVPKQLPHAVEFLFSVDGPTYFPRQVSFFRFDKELNRFEPSMILAFSGPEPLNNLTDGFFVIDSANLEPTDTTERYIARIESFQKAQQAAADSITIDR